MAIQYFSSTSLDVLADALAGSLERRRGDPFSRTVLLTPNLPLRRWLTYTLAGRRGIVANIEFKYLEEGLWEMAALLDSRGSQSLPTGRLKREWMQWMIAGVLLNTAPAEKDLAPFRAYTGRLDDLSDRAAVRKLWQLSERLSRLFREYETAAPDLTASWLSSAPVPTTAAPLWKAQRALYRALFARDGLRDRLARTTGERHLTPVEYVSEVLRDASVRKTTSPPVLRLFGVPALGVAQMRLLERFAEVLPVELYSLDLPPGAADSAGDLVERWGRAFAPRRDWLSAFPVQPLPAPRADKPGSRLAAVQNALQGISAATPPDDDSLELLACPGIRREVEAVRDRVVHLLEMQPDLKLTDIGILVPDMTQYRPHLEAVFLRDDLRVPFNLSDTTAEDDSVYAQAVEALLALAGGQFTRREFFALALNPCFLAAQELTRDDVMQWLDWADRLNIFRDFDTASRNFSWRHGLQRLRLGRIMFTGSEIRAYQDTVPFGDLRSSSPEAVTAFSSLVDALSRFRENCRQPRTASEWSELLQSALDEFVAVPEDREEEEVVRKELLQALNEFRAMDAILALASPASPPRVLDLPLLRELVTASVADIPSRRGHYLLGGVTLSALRPDRPIPFRVAFVLGLGEGVFPGHDSPASLDVRDPRHPRLPSPVEASRAALLEVLTSTRERIVFSYVSRNLQKDETFQPATLLRELEEALPFARLNRIDIPYTAASDRYVFGTPAAAPLPCYRRQDLLHAISRLSHERTMAAFSATDRTRFERLRIQAAEALERRTFTLSRDEMSAPAEVSIALDEFARFLRDPLAERLRRHVGLFDDDREDARALQEHEPFHLGGRDAAKLIRDALEAAAAAGTAASIPSAVAQTAQRGFQEHQWLGAAPQGEYGRLEHSVLDAKVSAAVERPGVCERLAKLKRIADVSIGRRTSSAGHQAFPTLQLNLQNGRVVRVTGEIANVFRSHEGGPVEFLAVAHNEHKSSLPPAWLLQPWLFYTALSAGESGSRTWLGNAGCKLWLLTSDGLKGWSYAPQSLDAARGYLSALAEACLDATRFDNLPLEIVLKVCDRSPEFTTHPPVDFSLRLQRELEHAEESSHGYSPRPFYTLLQAQVPSDAGALVRQHLAPFLSGTELDPGTDLDSFTKDGVEVRA